MDYCLKCLNDEIITLFAHLLYINGADGIMGFATFTLFGGIVLLIEQR